MDSCWGLIPARGGSKGISRKNLQEVGGKPLIAYTIEAALASESLAGVIVSTDDEEIADVARGLGAQVPFLRPAEFASDSASDLQVMKHFCDWMAGQGQGVEQLVYLRPTTPFKTAQDIDQVVAKLTGPQGFSGVRTVTAAHGVNHPYWMFCADQQDCLQAFVDGIRIEQYYQRQLLPPCYRLNGVVDGLWVKNLASGSIFGERVGFIELPEQQSLDIDTQYELALFEFLLQYRKSL